MAYTQQIRILEQKLQQLENSKHERDYTYKVMQLELEIRKLKRLEWEENYERIKMDEER
jgi:hypothetical protein